MILFHRTTVENAQAIITRGFRDSTAVEEYRVWMACSFGAVLVRVVAFG